MEVVNKLISNTKRLAIEEEEAKNELIRLKTQLIAEETYLANTMASKHSLTQQNAIYEQFLGMANNNLQMVLKSQDIAKSSMMVHSFLEVLVEKTHPTNQEQRECLASLMSKKEKMLTQYETSQTYSKILQEELEERKLSKLIEEKRNQLASLSESV